MSSKLKKVSINILVWLFIAWVLSKILKLVINIPHIEIILTIMGIILPIVNSLNNKKKARIITIISIAAVLIYAASAYSVNKARSIHKISSPSRVPSKIMQSSLQTQVSSQTGNNNAKVVINGGQDVEINGNNFNGRGQAVQTNSTKNVQLNGNNFNQ